MTPFLIFIAVAALIFYIAPQYMKLRAALGIPQLIQSNLPLLHKVELMLFGLKTPFLNTLALVWTFIMTEGDELRGFDWGQFMSHEHAVWVSAALWAAGLWSHFSGLNAAAATVPAIPALPAALPEAPPAPKAI